MPSSPLALLAWQPSHILGSPLTQLIVTRIGEKFLEWPEEDVSIDEVLTVVTLYWFTDCFPRCNYTYCGTFLVKPPFCLPSIDKPFGYSWFMCELAPGPKKVVEKKGRLVFYRQHENVSYNPQLLRSTTSHLTFDQGGHFAALERPIEFLQDIEDFMEVVLKER